MINMFLDGMLTAITWKKINLYQTKPKQTILNRLQPNLTKPNYFKQIIAKLNLTETEPKLTFRELPLEYFLVRGKNYSGKDLAAEKRASVETS